MRDQSRFSGRPHDSNLQARLARRRFVLLPRVALAHSLLAVWAFATTGLAGHAGHSVPGLSYALDMLEPLTGRRTKPVMITCCSDLHRGPAGHPATDATPGWSVAWARVRGRKLRLGDMDELWQFTGEEIGILAGTDVDGNHDPGSCGRAELRIGDALFLHGHRFDPLLVRLAGRPVTWLVGKVERWWPAADTWLGGLLRRHLLGGRRGVQERYVRKAAKYARKRRARQIVFGHLHQRFTLDHDGVLIYCTGCCVNGRMDFVRVGVLKDEGRRMKAEG